MATIGYKTTASGEDMMRQIARIAAGGYCEVTRGAFWNGKMFEAVQMSANQMKEHINALLSGENVERLPNLPRTQELALDALAAKHGLSYEFNPQTMNWIFRRNRVSDAPATLTK